MAIFVCTKSKAELFIFAIFFGFLIAKMNGYSYARDGFIGLQWLDARAGAQKLHLPGEVESNFRRNHGICDTRLSNSIFLGFFRLFVRKPRAIGLSAREPTFNCIFIEAVWFYETEIILVRFSSLCHHLFSLCFNITLCHTQRPKGFCWNFITRQSFNFQGWNASSCKRSNRSVMQYNWAFNL